MIKTTNSKLNTNNIIEIITYSNAVKLQNSTITTLNLEEHKTVLEFLKILDKTCQVIFRGDNLEKTYNKLYSNPKNVDDKFKKIGMKVFMIGEKAPRYLFGIQTTEEYENLNIGSTDSSIFKIIFQNFKIVCDKISKGVIDDLFENDFLKTFFSNDINEEIFLQKILDLPFEQKIKIKLYYLWMLHILDETNYKSISNFVSTTKSFKQAYFFAKDSKDEGLIYISWIPISQKDESFDDLRGTREIQVLLEELGLPYYTSKPYYEELEISKLGVIFPQYIFGIYNLSDNMFLINSYLINDTKFHWNDQAHLQKIINEGIKIDQTKFDEYMKDTNYMAEVERKKNGSWFEKLSNFISPKP